jgi:DDE superfamily endonuclease
VWVSGPLPGAVHDLTAARIWGIVRELAASRSHRAGGQGIRRAGEHVQIPYRGRGKPASQKEANRAHARLRSPGERANAQLKTWRILRKLRCCPGVRRPGSARIRWNQSSLFSLWFSSAGR